MGRSQKKLYQWVSLDFTKVSSFFFQLIQFDFKVACSSQIILFQIKIIEYFFVYFSPFATDNTKVIMIGYNFIIILYFE